MSAENKPRRVYHIGPWRYVWVRLVFGPIAIFFVALGLFAEPPGEGAPLLLGAALWLICPLLVTLLVRTAWLEISEAGVRLHQIGYRLEAPWTGIIGLRLDRGHEGFITAQPVGGKGAGLLAGAGRALPYAGVQFYDDEQQALLDEHRLHPDRSHSSRICARNAAAGYRAACSASARRPRGTRRAPGALPSGKNRTRPQIDSLRNHGRSVNGPCCR